MILLDTSIWIRTWADRPGFVAAVEELVQQDRAGGHALVHGELLLGDHGARAQVLDDYCELPWAATVAHAEAVYLVRARRLAGRGVGWVDIHLLASALASGWRLWTADQRLASIATEFGIAWQPR